jgi:glutaminyl-tRNA synthetase
MDSLNPDSLTVLTGCKLEPSLASSNSGDIFQFERLGYFCQDPDSTEERLVFNRAVALRDSWARVQRNS